VIFTSRPLELKLVALQHQLAVLRRQRPGRAQLSSLDRLLWVLLYRIWPQVIDTMVLVKPVTVVAWHRASGSIGVGDHGVRDGPANSRPLPSARTYTRDASCPRTGPAHRPTANRHG
jgi:hypothetical protein